MDGWVEGWREEEIRGVVMTNELGDSGFGDRG